jgi:hypothetical protein
MPQETKLKIMGENALQVFRRIPAPAEMTAQAVEGQGDA